MCCSRLCVRLARVKDYGMCAGPACAFRHDAQTARGGISGLPPREDDAPGSSPASASRVCTFWAQGKCKKGPRSANLEIAAQHT